LESTLVTSIDQLGNKEVNELEFTFVPASLYAYNIGEGTLEKKKREDK